MEHEDFYEEVSSEDEEVAIAPPVVQNEPLGLNIPVPGTESPESPAASPSPASSEAPGQGRVGIEIPLDENMVAPPSPAPAVDYISDDEVFRAEDLQIYSLRSLLGLEMWRDAMQQYRGTPALCIQFPQFQPFLQPSCNHCKGPVGGTFAVSGRRECSF